MKTKFLRFALLSIFKFVVLTIFSLYILSGCQQEIEEIIEPPNDQVLTTDSTVAILIQRTALRDGSIDNIIDGSSCTTLELPITVIVNGLEIILDSKEDFYTVEYIIDKFEDDEDLIEIIYPVTVILADHSELKLSNKDDFDHLISQCTESGDDDDIECVDFKFPLSISIYNSDNQVSDVITLHDDKELYDFIHNLKKNDYASINYPIVLVFSEGEELVIHNNHELENALKDAINACDEDDDNDHNDDDADDTDLVKVLIDGHWEITYLFNKIDLTEGFAGYTFTFFEGGRAFAKNVNSFIEGKWYSNGNDGGLELEFDFGSESPFSELHDRWDIIEFDGAIIKLKDGNDGDESKEYLTFQRPEDKGGNISDVIVDGSWVVANYTKSGTDETEVYNDFEFHFSADQIVKAKLGEELIQGYWSVLTNNEGIKKLLLDFGSFEPLNKFNNDWEIIEVTAGRIELKDVSGIDESIVKLVFERPSDPPIISTVIIEGLWIVANYDNSGTNETDVYNDIIFNFSADKTVAVTKGNDLFEGSWSVMTNNDGVQKLVLDFGQAIPVNKFNNDWEIVDVREARIELKDESSVDESYAKLVFERL